MYDRAKMRASIEAIGASVDFARSIREAIDILRAGADLDRPVAVVAVGDGASDLDPVEFAGRVRADPALAGTRLILTSASGGKPLPEDSAALFDVSLPGTGPRRRIFDVIYELLRTEDTLPGIAPEPKRSGDIPSLAGRRILIAEDVETNQMLLRAILAPTGASFEIVENGAAAIERHRMEPADLILMDLLMPGVGGITALKRIRAMGGVIGAVPVLALTAYALGTDRRKAIAAGMDGYLAKPILIEEFYAALRRFLLPAEAG
jgi:CheY-like chemotaxis protein